MATTPKGPWTLAVPFLKRSMKFHPARPTASPTSQLRRTITVMTIRLMRRWRLHRNDDWLGLRRLGHGLVLPSLLLGRRLLPLLANLRIRFLVQPVHRHLRNCGKDLWTIWRCWFWRQCTTLVQVPMLAALSRMDHTELEARHRLITRVPAVRGHAPGRRRLWKLGFQLRAAGDDWASTKRFTDRGGQTHALPAGIRVGLLPAVVRTVVGLSAKAATTYTRGRDGNAYRRDQEWELEQMGKRRLEPGPTA